MTASICNITDCDTSKIFARGMCVKHYKRWYRNGDPSVVKCAPNGDRKTHPLYATYTNMKARCFNANSKHFKDYGGRGISICNRWLGVDGFTNFCLDMGARPFGSTIDRTNNDLSYSPENCRWASKAEQAQNRRLRSGNTSGTAGVYKRGNSWVAQIGRFNKYIYLGSFSEKNDAVMARKQAESMV